IAQLLYWLARLYSQMSQDLGRGHKHSHCRSALASGPATNGDGHQVTAVVDHLGEAAGGPLVDVTGHVSAAIGTDRDSVGVVLIIGLAEQPNLGPRRETTLLVITGSSHFEDGDAEPSNRSGVRVDPLPTRGL